MGFLQNYISECDKNICFLFFKLATISASSSVKFNAKNVREQRRGWPGIRTR